MPDPPIDEGRQVGALLLGGALEHRAAPLPRADLRGLDDPVHLSGVDDPLAIPAGAPDDLVEGRTAPRAIEDARSSGRARPRCPRTREPPSLHHPVRLLCAV